MLRHLIVGDKLFAIRTYRRILPALGVLLPLGGGDVVVPDFESGGLLAGGFLGGAGAGAVGLQGGEAGGFVVLGCGWLVGLLRSW